MEKFYDKRGRNGAVQSRFRRYALPWTVCCKCPFKGFCLSEQNVKVRHGRHIERNIYEAARIDNRKRVINSRHIYKRRQAIVEHPFGTIKRSWGYYYTLLKGREKVNAEYGIVFLIYNLRRAINILGFEGIKSLIGQQLLVYLVLYMPFGAAFFSNSRNQLPSAAEHWWFLGAKSGLDWKGVGSFLTACVPCYNKKMKIHEFDIEKGIYKFELDEMKTKIHSHPTF